MAHHGQNGMRKDFYFNTGNLETIEIRELKDSLGIKAHYLTFEGLTKID